MFGLQPQYELVTNVESMSREGVTYEIKRNIATNHLSCSCPAFKFQRKEVEDRSCKHTILIEEKGIMQVQHEARQHRNYSVTEGELEAMLTQALVEATN